MDVLSFLSNNIREFTPLYSMNVSIGYKSNGSLYSIDRGIETDDYECKLMYRERSDTLFEMINYIRTNREITLPPTKDRIFGEHIINTDNNFDIMITNISDITNISLGVVSVEITIRLKNPIFDTYIGFPELKCLNATYKIIHNWNIINTLTYYNDYYQGDFETDKYEFEGEYILHKDELVQLMLWNFQLSRLSILNINDGDFGLINMFGTNDTTHDIIVTDLTYDLYGPMYRKVKLKIAKVG